MIGYFAVVDKSPYQAARVNVLLNAFFSSPSEKTFFFDVDIQCGKKQIQMWFIVVCTLIDNEYASLLFSQTFFCVMFQYVERVCKSF